MLLSKSEVPMLHWAFSSLTGAILQTLSPELRQWSFVGTSRPIAVQDSGFRCFASSLRWFLVPAEGGDVLNTCCSDFRSSSALTCLEV